VILLPPKNFLNLPAEWSALEQSEVVILPLPYEHTTSYGKGTASGPPAVLEASHKLELYDEELDAEIFKLSGGIATCRPMEFGKVDADAVEAIRNQVHALIRQDKMVVSIGGEHTITVGAARAHTECYEDLSVLHLDAHSDLREEYEGNRYSHACVMARVHEFNKNIVQVGIRSQCSAEADFIRTHGIKTFYDSGIRQGAYGGQGEWQDAVVASLGEHIYLTLDCDFFDPGLMPAVGTPEPGGFGWQEAIAFLRLVAKRKRIVGFDVAELSPVPNLLHPEFIIAKLIYKIIGYTFQR
jgi:agmatinase